MLLKKQWIIAGILVIQGCSSMNSAVSHPVVSLATLPFKIVGTMVGALIGAAVGMGYTEGIASHLNEDS